MDLQMAGKKVLVTGGSKGIGFACAQVFAAEGCDVVLVSRNGAALDAAAARLPTDGGGTVAVHAADLADPEQRERLAATVPDVDVLVNNAGAAPFGDVLSIDIDTWRAGWELKVFGYIHLTMLYLEQMRTRGSGTIVNVIGSAGRAPRGDYVCGATANAALIAFTEAVGGQSPDLGVRVVGVNPGYTATERFLREPIEGEGPDEAELRERFPTIRVSTPAAVADLVAFLASDRARGTSGVVADCDQGQMHSGPTIPISR